MPSIELHQLKTYVLSNFSKKPGCYTTLIEVFINNKLYYNIMLKMDMIASEADVFLTAEEKPLRDIMQISDRKVQKQKCEELVDAYVKKKTSIVEKPVVATPKFFQQSISEDNACVMEKQQTQQAFLKEKKDVSSRHNVPQWNCCYIFEGKKPAQCIKCHHALKKVTTLFITKKKYKKKQTEYTLLFCPQCRIHYVKEGSFCSQYPSLWKVVKKVGANYDMEKMDKRTSIKEKLTKEQKLQQAERNLQKQTQELLHGQHTMQERKISVLPVNAKRQEPQERKDGAENQITLQDFVVRRTTFRCLHQQHELKNIDAEVGIIDRYGDISSTKVSAGYCKNCNLFFIMESTYQNLKMKGTPMCRISDEKTYMSGGIAENGMKLSQESILMQYGYSVSQMEGLSDSRRQKILAVLVDNKILTRSDIIGYLDFFINQRKHQHKYEKAIEKWENDREFVSRYRTGRYTEYKINSIRRKY